VAVGVPLLWVGLSLSGCGDSRLDPAGLRHADKAALENLPPGPITRRRAGARPKPSARPRPGPQPRPRAAAGATIPTPPYRLDVRVDPADLALLPENAALTAAIRPDLPVGLSRLLGPHGQTLGRLPALGWLGQQLLTQSLATPLGLRTDRAILVSLLSTTGAFERLNKHLEVQVQKTVKPGPAPQINALKPAQLPATALRIRIVAQVADPQKTRAGLQALVSRARQGGHKTLHLTNALTATATATATATTAATATATTATATTTTTAPKPLAGLAAKGVLVVGYGPDHAQTWTLSGNRLLVDFLLPVSGAWSPTRAAKDLAAILASPARTTPVNPFARVILQSSADLSLLIRGPELAQAAKWIGVRELLGALQNATSTQLPRRLGQGWRVANIPIVLQSAGTRPLDGCGVRLYLVGAHPQLRISWHLTPPGRKLLDKPTGAVTGSDLARENTLVDRWLKPLAALVPRLLPAVGVFAKPGLNTALQEGGFFMWPLALAELWPRLLPVKPVRKAVLKILRTQIRPARFVRRINVRQQGKVLELVLEAKPPAK
jgi:hypothetical protein